MICLRCGHCCFNYEVIIIDDPDIGLDPNNIKEKHTGDRCQHITGDVCGEYSCSIHDKLWYDQTPCWQHGQIEKSADTHCRMGVYFLKKERKYAL